MLDSLYKFLVLNDNVGIPGVGIFSVANTPAKFDGSSFTSPSQQIQFEKGAALTDKSLYQFLAAEQGITEVDAVRRFQDFAYQLRKDIQSNSFVELSSIGLLRKNNLGELDFEPSSAITNYLPNLVPVEVEQTATHLIQSESEVVSEEYLTENTSSEDRWWIWPTVLALLALAAIGYFYMTEV